MSRYFGLFMAISVSAFADQTVMLKAGSDVTLEQLADRTRVACEGEAISSKCFCEYSGGYYTPVMLVNDKKIVLDRQMPGKKECFDALSSNPSCK